MIRQWCVGAPSVICRRCNNQTSIDYRPIDCSRWVSAIYIGLPIVGWHMDRHLGRYSSKTEDPTIINLCDCSRGFHFCAIFHIADVMPLPDRCSISRLAVQFLSGLFGGFGDPLEVTLCRFFLCWYAISCYCKLFARCSSLSKITIVFMICLKCFCLATT